MAVNPVATLFAYMITTGDAAQATYQQQKPLILSAIKRAADSGIDMIQIREKQLLAKQLLDLTTDVVEMTAETAAQILVNDRWDVALAAGAAGVHLTSRSMPVRVVRGHVGPDFLIGISCHTESEVAAAAADGASFAAFGPIFSTPGKADALGIDALSRVCRQNPGFPIAALGGINSQNCLDVLAAGATGVAGIRVFTDEAEAGALLLQLSK